MIGITEESLRKAEKAANDNRVRMGDAKAPSLLDDMAKSFSDANEQANKIIAEIAADDEKKRKERAQKLAELGVKGVAGRLADGAADIVNALAQLTNPKKEDTGAGKGGGGSAAVADTWTPYYQSFLDAQSKALSKAEQIEFQYRQKIKELDDKFAANAGVSQEQYNSVRLALDKEYVDAKKALEQEAINFLEQLRGNENYSLQSEYLQKLELLQQYHEQRLISEQDFLEQEKAIRDAYYAEDAEITKRRRQEKFDKQAEPYLQQASALGQLSQAFSGLTSSMDESSGAYRALFAVQKGFAVASATMNAVVAWMNAFANGGPWPANLAAYGQAVAMTTSILAELSSIKAYDKGGSIPAGAVGLVGEIGPELIRGPASVTSRKDTAAMLGGKDITINLIEDASRAGQVGKTETDSGEIIDIVVANIRSGGGVSDAIGTAYGLSRRGQ